MGDINHSSGFIASLRTQVSDVMQSKLAGFMVIQPCVSLCVDKVTIARRTVDLTAILAVVPGAPLEHIIHSFVIRAPVVHDHTGEGQAKETASSLAAVGVTHSDKLAAICTDGQYLVNSVPSKLLHIMATADPTTTRTPCVPVLRDANLLLELADKDSRRHNQHHDIDQQTAHK